MAITPEPATPVAGAAPGPPRFRRRREGKLIAGVASGLADHLRLDPLHVRIAFALLTGLGGLGPVLYGAYWVFVRQEGPADRDAPAGLAAAGRRGLRLLPRRAEEEQYGQLIALLLVGLGAVLLLQTTDLGVSPVFLWPALAIAAGLAVLWRQADEADAVRAAGFAPGDGPPEGDRHRLVRGRTFAIARFAAGVVLVGLGVASFLAFNGGPAAVGQGLVGGAVVLGGGALIVGPWLLRTWRSLADERQERIRSQMHADLAAHLHDSVLQTLALIQRQAHDPREVVRLARGQERDLRAFLYADVHAPDAPAPAETLAAALRRVAAEVEDDHGVPVEVVTVGDIALDDGGLALVAAAREAMANAARHSGADLVDVFAEVDGAAVTAYVRDRGRGFDLDGVPEDRAGVRHSIVGRMERHGGRASVRTEPGAGTEVRLQTGG